MKITLEFDVPDWFMSSHLESEESLIKREILISLFEVDSLFGFEDSDGSLQDFIRNLVDSESLEDVVFGLTKMEHCKNVVEKCYERLKKIKFTETKEPVTETYIYPYSIKDLVSKLITDLHIKVISHHHTADDMEYVVLKFNDETAKAHFDRIMSAYKIVAKSQTIDGYDFQGIK